MIAVIPESFMANRRMEYREGARYVGGADNEGGVPTLIVYI